MGYHPCVTIDVDRGRGLAALGAVALLAALTGCSAGGRGTPDGPVRAVEAFESALQRGDMAAACDLLSPPTRRELEQSQGERCPKALDEEDLPAVAAPGDVEVFGDEAIAHAQGDVLFLTSVGGAWRVSAAGCTPRPDEPYDCEVKGS